MQPLNGGSLSGRDEDLESTASVWINRYVGIQYNMCNGYLQQGR